MDSTPYHQRTGKPGALQEALKIASVAGETFIAEVVSRVQGIDARELVRQLASVVDRQHGLVRSEGTERLGQQPLSHYRFGHILFQKYLYQTLDAAERLYLHEAVGQALEEAYGAQADNVAVQLAHHFQMAGLTAKAVDNLYRAGLRAAWRAAHREAIVHFTQGIDLLQRAPRLAESAQQELRLQIAAELTEIGKNQVARPNPYKALLSYELQDAPLFFGRDQNCTELLGALDQGRLTVLYAESGAGKTSLLKAGLMSRQDRDSTWLPRHHPGRAADSR